MHSFTVNIELENVLSLSEDDDDDQKDTCEVNYEHLAPFEHKLRPAPREPKHKAAEPLDDDAKTDPYADETDDAEEEEPQQQEDEPEEEAAEDYDKSLILDKDIAIAKMLNKQMYKNVRKLCATDQGSVWRARSPKKLGAQSVVIKVASKLHYKTAKTQHEDILKEISLLRRINLLSEQPGQAVLGRVIGLLDTLHNDEHYVAVLEDGGTDLFSFVTACHRMLAAGTLTVSEWHKTVKLLTRRLVELLHGLHSSVRVCHGDISLENVLISAVEWIAYPDQYKRWKKRLAPDFALKLIDFGAALDCSDSEQFASTSVVGKAMYCSPQIYALQNRRSTQAFDGRATDVWSLGVCLFIMAVGNPPWHKPDEHSSKLFETIVLGRDLDCVLKAWNRSHFVDDALKDLLLRIFVVNEARRIGTRDILRHEWLA